MLSKQHIDITKQKTDTTLFIETRDGHLFEIRVVIPEKAIIEISGTEPRLKQSVLGILAPEHCIGLRLKMTIIFKNGNYVSAPVIHLTVKGPGYSYTVF